MGETATHSSGHRVRSFLLGLLTLCGTAGFTNNGFAGGGPENVFLVANSADMTSLTIANHFADWRQLPAGNVLEIDWPKAPPRVDMETFRSRLLGPILTAIKKRKLTDQIDYIVYSSGFPFAVQFSQDLGKPKQERFDEASITGLTYLHELVMNRERTYTGAVNRYARNVLRPFRSVGSQGFRSQYGFEQTGKRSSIGSRYYLSMMLGYTQGKETNSLAEVLRYLSLAKKADGTTPDGSVYFVKVNDIRSKVREYFFPEVAETLKELGVNAEVIQGDRTLRDCLPVGKQDVMGAMVGFYKFSWPASGSKMLPGAICEHFTSWGGELTGGHTQQQSLLCDFLRYGAVAASGTVTEPYAITGPDESRWNNPKFPHPLLHVHYARGCSVAESFYQSVLAPYQLIIVGDPLCQPWAVAPEVSIDGLTTTKPVSGTQEFRVSARSATGFSIRNFDVFIDGVKLTRALPGKPIRLDTTKLNNGYHELRVVAIEESSVETQGRAIAKFVSINGETDPSDGKPTGVTAKLTPANGKLRANGAGFVEVQSRGAREVRLYKGRKLLGKTTGASGRFRITAADLGGGLSKLTPVSIPKSRGVKPMFGFPVEVSVQLGL